MRRLDAGQVDPANPPPAAAPSSHIESGQLAGANQIAQDSGRQSAKL
jgi:hypothetical protein